MFLRTSKTSSQTGVACAHDCLGAVGHLQLAEDVRDVVLHRLDADGEVFGNGSVALALRYEVKNLSLALGQVRESDGRGSLGEGREIMDHPLGDGGAENRFASVDSLYCAHQFILVCVFEQIAASARAHGSEH